MKILLVLFTLIGAIFMLLYSILSWGVAASFTYEWFILPYFSDLPDLNWKIFAGIMFFVTCFNHNSTTSFIKEEYKDNLQGITAGILSPWSLLLLGWIFKGIFL